GLALSSVPHAAARAGGRPAADLRRGQRDPRHADRQHRPPSGPLPRPPSSARRAPPRRGRRAGPQRETTVTTPKGDDALLGSLHQAVARHDPVPDGVVTAARSAFFMAALDAELATLVYDSSFGDGDTRALV